MSIITFKTISKTFYFPIMAPIFWVLVVNSALGERKRGRSGPLVLNYLIVFKPFASKCDMVS